MAEVVPSDGRQPEVDVYQETGLNAGAELDEELANAGPPHEELFGDFKPGEVPELKKEVALIHALEAQVQDLFYLQEDVLRTGGMTQQFALEAERLIPGFGGGTPVAYYSAQPSATRYRLSLEEINKGLWAAIAALVAIVVAAIAKFVMYLLGRKSPQDAAQESQARAKEAKENLQQLEENHRRVEELRQLTQAGQVTTLDARGEPEKMITMSSLMEDLWTDQTRYEHALAFLRLPDPIFRDIVQQGPYSRAFRELSHNLPALKDALKLKVQELSHIAHLDRTSFQETDRISNTRALRVISQPIALTLQGQKIELRSAGQRLAQLREEVAQVRSSHPKPLNLDELVVSVIQAYRSSDVVRFFEEQHELLQVLAELDTALQRVQKTAGDLSRDGAVGANSEGIAGQIRQVILEVSQDFAGYQRLFAELTTYGRYLEHLAMQTVGFANEIESQLFAMARRGHVKLPESWKERSAKDRLTKLSAIFQAVQPKK